MAFLRFITRPFILLIAIAYLATHATYADVPSQTAAPTPDTIVADPDLRSPRAAVSHFLTAMEPKDGEPDISRATKALDISELPELVRDELARDAAIKLYTILNYKEITASKITSATATSPLVVDDIGTHTLYLEQVGPNWKFSKSTVKELPDIFREIENNLSRKEMRKLGGNTAMWLTVRSYVPEQLKGTTFILEDWHWIAALLTLCAAILVHLTLVFFIRSVIYRVIPSRFSDAPATATASIRKPIFAIVFTSALQIFLSSFDLQVDFYTWAITWISTVRILAIMLLSIRLIPMFTERVNRFTSEATSVREDILYPLVEKAAWLCIVVIGVVQILWTHGVNVSGLAAGLGLGGLAFALAAKDTVENIFGAVAILIDQPFKVGDSISMSGINGTVEHIGLRSTRIRTPENSLLSLPNSKIIASHVDNLGARSAVRIKTVLHLPLSTTSTSLEALCSGIRAVLTSYPACMKDSVVVHFTDFAASGLSVLVQFNVHCQTWSEEQQRKEEVFLAILRLLKELGLSLAPPTQEISVRQNMEERVDIPAQAGLEAVKRLSLSWK